MSEDYLIHYGKLGMKWGVRHDPVRKSSGSRTSKSSKKSNQNTFSSLKSKAQKVLSKINKQKVKKVLKVGAIAAGVAVAGTIGGIAVSQILDQAKNIQGVNLPKVSTGENVIGTVNSFKSAGSNRISVTKELVGSTTPHKPGTPVTFDDLAIAFRQVNLNDIKEKREAGKRVMSEVLPLNTRTRISQEVPLSYIYDLRTEPFIGYKGKSFPNLNNQWSRRVY